MRNSYRPLKRRQSKAFALRRQELAQKEEASIEGNQTENVSDFWNAATSKLQIDETVVVKKENDVRDMKKSFDDEYLKDLMNAEISGVSESAICKEENQSVIKSLSLGVENVVEFFDDEKMSLSGVDGSELLSFNKENMDIVESERKNINFEYKVEDKKRRKKNKKGGSVKNNRAYKKIDNESEDKLTLKIENTNDLENTSQGSEQHEVLYSEFDDSIKTDGSLSIEPVSFIKNVGDLAYINNINEINSSKNQVAYLLQNKDIETSIIFLKQGSYVKKSTADKSFSLFVIKGCIRIEVDEKEVILKKYGLVVINKNEEYFVSNIGKSEATLYLTYSIQ